MAVLSSNAVAWPVGYPLLSAWLYFYLKGLSFCFFHFIFIHEDGVNSCLGLLFFARGMRIVNGV